VDYSQLIPATTLTAFSFKVRPGGEPLLWIESPAIGTTPTLTFFVSGGIGETQYQLLIVATMGDTDVRTDILNVNISGNGCGCSPPMPKQMFADATSGDGIIITNIAPRFFVSSTPPVNPNVLDRWYDTASGQMSDYITNGATNGWVPGVSTEGGGGGGGSNIIKMEPITPDGVTTTFTMVASDGTTVNVSGTNYLFVSVDGVWQEGPNQYLVSGNQITFSQAPSVDSHIFMYWFAPMPATGVF
jgi:hypothetical protein